MPSLQLRPLPHTDGERILLYGAEGVGKTYAALRCIEAGEGQGYYLDTDRSARRMLASPRWAALRDRVEVATPRTWPDYVGNVEKWLDKASEKDWLVIDLYGRAWSDVQSHFSEQVFGLKHDEHLLGYRKHLEAAGGKGSKSEFSAMTDWPTILGLYRRLTGNILDWPGHVMLVCATKSINDQFDSAAVKERFGGVGVKPDADKHAGHIVHSVLYMGANRRVTSLKDRERATLDGKRVDDFGRHPPTPTR